MNFEQIKKACAALIVVGCGFSSSALAGAPGDMVDSDGCEWHYGTGNNNCNTGSSNPRVTVQGISTGYCVTDPGSTSAYAAILCTTGELYRGQVGLGGLTQCSVCIKSGLPSLSVCGQNNVCQNKP